MSITFIPAQDTQYLRDLLEDVPNNLQYLVSVTDIVVPFAYDGVKFILTVSQPGIPVTIEIDRPSELGMSRTDPPSTVIIIPRDEVTEVTLYLSSGLNKVDITSDLGDTFLRLGVATWATWIYTFGKIVNNGTSTRLANIEDSVLSWTGSMITERWFKENDLLPRSNALHRLGMRTLVDGYNNSSRKRSVERIAAAIMGNNPVIVPTRNNSMVDPITSWPRYSLPEEFSGVEFHAWFLDICLMSFVTAGRYIENFPNIWEGLRWSESSVSYKAVSTGETHLLLNAEGSNGCSVEDVLLEEECFGWIRPFVRITKTKSFIICMASYPIDTGVEVCNALGAVYWDCDTLTMEELVHDPNMVDVEDPTGDGWVGHSLDGRPDYAFGGSFDTYGVVESFLADQCPYERGVVATPLLTNRTDSTVNNPMTAFGTLNVSTGHGPLIAPMPQ